MNLNLFHKYIFNDKFIENILTYDCKDIKVIENFLLLLKTLHMYAEFNNGNCFSEADLNTCFKNKNKLYTIDKQIKTALQKNCKSQFICFLGTSNSVERYVFVIHSLTEYYKNSDWRNVYLTSSWIPKILIFNLLKYKFMDETLLINNGVDYKLVDDIISYYNSFVPLNNITKVEKT